MELELDLKASITTKIGINRETPDTTGRMDTQDSGDNLGGALTPSRIFTSFFSLNLDIYNVSQTSE